MANLDRLPRIQYDSQDFEAIVTSLQTYVQKNYANYWNDFFTSNLGQCFIELLAYIGDQLNFYLNKRVNNLYLENCDRYDIILMLSRLLGYSATGPVGGRLNVCARRGGESSYEEYPELTADGDRILIKGGYWSGQTYYPGESIVVDDLTFEVLEDVSIYKVIPVGSYPSATVREERTVYDPEDPLNTMKLIEFYMTEGRTVQDSFTSDGLSFQRYESNSASVIEGSWKVRVNTDDWTQATDNSFVNHVVGDKVYTVDYIGGLKIRITFGDGVTYAEKPAENDVINLVYRIGGGDETNVAAEVLDPDEHSVPCTYYPDAGGSSSDEISLDNNRFTTSTQLGISEVIGIGLGTVGPYSGILHNFPIVAGTFAPTDGTEVFTDDGTGTLTGSGGGTGTINYTTGLFSVTFGAVVPLATSITSTYSVLYDYGGQAVYGADTQDIESIRIEAPKYMKSTNRAITKEDIEVLALNFEDGNTGEQVFKASVNRAEEVLKYVGSDGTLKAGYSSGDQFIKYEGHQISVYLPSFGANIVRVFIWSLGPLGQPIESSTSIVNLLSTYFNYGTNNAGEIPMVSVQYLVDKGSFKDITINLNATLTTSTSTTTGIWYDPVFSAEELTTQIKAGIVELFNGLEPASAFSIMEVWRVVSAIDGILKFSVQLDGGSGYVTDDIEVDVDEIARMVDSDTDIIFTLVPKV